MEKPMPEGMSGWMPGAGGGRTPVYALLDNVRSLYNVGSMYSTSDGACLAGLFLCGYTPCPPRKEIEKTALGATETVPWARYQDARKAVARIRELGARVCVLEVRPGARPYTDLTPADFPLCLVVGNELTGVSPLLLAEADMTIRIPMLGSKNSLNAAVAFGIAVYECLRVITPRNRTPA
jgi:tRNA G18 (ribose-2'-O)-methylase SpoU